MSIHHWRRRTRLAGADGRPLGFLPVAVTAPVGPETTAAGSIEIELGSVRVRVDARVDEAALRRVLRALGTATVLELPQKGVQDLTALCRQRSQNSRKPATWSDVVCPYHGKVHFFQYARRAGSKP
jgi:hypothetical protein